MYFLWIRLGFLRNLYDRWVDDPTNVYSRRTDREWTHVIQERSHLYFLVEYLLQDSSYAVGDLNAPVKLFEQCHHHTITYQLLGFVYFLMFEFMFKRELYAGAEGKCKIPARMTAVSFFVDIASEECNAGV